MRTCLSLLLPLNPFLAGVMVECNVFALSFLPFLL